MSDAVVCPDIQYTIAIDIPREVPQFAERIRGVAPDAQDAWLKGHRTPSLIIKKPIVDLFNVLGQVYGYDLAVERMLHDVKPKPSKAEAVRAVREWVMRPSRPRVRGPQQPGFAETV